MQRRQLVRFWALVILPFALLLVCPALQQIEVWIRPANKVSLRVTDEAGRPQAQATLTFRQRGWRSVIPIPWFAHWRTKGSAYPLTTNAAGVVSTGLKDDYLCLDGLILADGRRPRFTCRLRRLSAVQYPLQVGQSGMTLTMYSITGREGVQEFDVIIRGGDWEAPPYGQGKQ